MYLVTKRVLNMNLAAIHTSSNVSSVLYWRLWAPSYSYHCFSQSVTHALYHLAALPEYQQLLREEVDTLVSAEGWSKATMGKMWKLDSFLKESQRYNGISLSK